MVTVSKCEVLFVFSQSTCPRLLYQKQTSDSVDRLILTVLMRRWSALASYHVCSLLMLFLKSHLWAQGVHTVPKQGSESSFEWSDGSAFDYVPWNSPQSPGDCVVLYPKGIWRHERCLSVKDGAVCYKPTKRKTWFWRTMCLLKFDNVCTSSFNEHINRNKACPQAL